MSTRRSTGVDPGRFVCYEAKPMFKALKYTHFLIGDDEPLMILLTYDVNTSSESGARRLRMVARACEAYGIRVQKSVFELVLDPAQLVTLKGRLSDIIDSSQDSVRFYNLGANYKHRIETLGQIPKVEQEGVLIL